VIPRRLRYPLAILATGLCLGAEPAPLRLWPGAAPGDRGDFGEEKDMFTPQDGLIAGKPIIRLGNVSVPTITLFRPPAERDTGTAVLVLPGGGYRILAMDLEGTEVCTWLNSIGVTGILLKYRVPEREGQAPYMAPLQDAQRAMGLVRLHARDLGIDPLHIGTLGFSAGGHLSATLCTHGNTRTYTHLDNADDVSCHPDFQLLIYPGGLVSKNDGYALSPEAAVNGDTPPTFMVMAQDDPVHVENVLGYAMALQAEKIPMELHLYPSGHHGYGLRSTSDYVTSWPLRAADWMRSRGLLETK
jgi:acetyl esterase/lipase